MLLGAGALKRSPILYRFSMFLSNTHCPQPRLSRQPCSQNQEESVAPILTPSWMWLFSPLTWVQPQPTLSAGNGPDVKVEIHMWLFSWCYLHEGEKSEEGITVAFTCKGL